MNPLEDLYPLFKEEASELIDRFGVLAGSLSLEEAADNRKRISEMLRIMHNLKGAARTVSHVGIERLAHQIETDLSPFDKANATVTKTVQDQLKAATSALQMLLETAEPEADGQALAAPKEVPQSEASKGASIRVDTARFDALMGSSGDLLMSRARMEARHRRFLQLTERIEKQAAKMGKSGDFYETICEMRSVIQTDNRDLIDFGHLTDKITQAMKHLRMVPLRLAEKEWRATVRNACGETGKRIDVVVNTGTIQLDKQVLDQLRDPMMHILRNAVSHGIETPEARRDAGKPEEGRIEINASLKGAMVQLTIRDDGRGIDLDRIRASAIRTKAVPPERLSQLSDKDLVDLLFHSGFSTSETVTQLSGRGVGLDVVRSNIEALGGNVRAEAAPEDGGAVFILSVPLSILSTVGLKVRSGATSYALPLEYVIKTVQAEEDEISQLDGHPVLSQKGADPIRLVHLSALVGDRRALKKTGKIVVLSRSNIQLGVLVDAIEEQYEFVTQPLPWNLEHISGVNGGSLMPDGTVVVVIDVPFLFEKALTASKPAYSNTPTQQPSGTSHIRRILVADDSLSVRTMEKNMLLDAGHEVSLAQDGDDAWEQLQNGVFDLVVSDIDMPKLNGFELTRRIRGSKRFDDLPVILVTSLDSAEHRAEGEQAGADEYIVKGTFDQKHLLDVVARYL